MFLQDEKTFNAFHNQCYELQVGDRVKANYLNCTLDAVVEFEGVILSMDDNVALVSTPQNEAKKFLVSDLEFTLLQYDSEKKRYLVGKKYQIDASTLLIEKCVPSLNCLAK